MLAPDLSLGFYNSFYIALGVAAYLLVPSNLLRQLALLVVSCAIYWTISGRLVAILFLISTIDFLLVSLMLKRTELRRLCLVSSIALNFGVLFYFKYFNFFVDQFKLIFAQTGAAGTGALDIAIPVGISFIVFHGVGHSIDVYRGKIAQPRYLDYLLYIAYFPKILAGPITRSVEFIPQLDRIGRIPLDNLTSGAELILLGLFKKIVVAAIFGQYWNELQTAKDGGILLVYAAGACYGLFLLADFSGYTDIARGVSRILGIELARNFDQPYGATSVSNFWRRWHMSLSFWLRDYLYIPLGGSRYGLPRTIFNLLVTMTLCGLWHGAAWTFVLWGVAHGLVMSAERLTREKLPFLKLPALIRLCLTFFFLSLTWILFASPDLTSARMLLGHVVEAPSPVNSQLLLLSLATLALGPLLSYFGVYTRLLRRMEAGNALAFAVNTFMIIAIAIQLWRGTNVSEFVYFRF